MDDSLFECHDELENWARWVACQVPSLTRPVRAFKTTGKFSRAVARSAPCDLKAAAATDQVLCQLPRPVFLDLAREYLLQVQAQPEPVAEQLLAYRWARGRLFSA
jgi:hypothetical protein